MNSFSQDIIREWNLSSLPETERALTLERISRNIFQALLVRSLDILSEKEEESLDALLDKDSTTTQDVLAFLELKIPTFKQLVIEERQNIKKSLLVPVS